VGSLATAAASLLVPRDGSYVPIVLALALAAFLGSVALGPAAERIEGRKDPGSFVLDEVAGQLVALTALPPVGLGDVLFAFAAFRLFDIVKPFPARRLERLRGGFGIALDDIVAGLYATIALHLYRAITG
jgi:phosphatidylglycerophosphatase A